MSDWRADIASLRAWVKDHLDKLPMRLFGATLIAATSSSGSRDAVEKADDATDPSSKSKAQRPAVRPQPWGLASRPVRGIRGFWARLGTSNVALLGVLPQSKYGPQNLSEGDTCLYASGGNQVWLKSDGSVSVTDKVGSQVTLDPSTGIATFSGANGTNLGAGTAQVLCVGAVDGMGLPITQAPACAASKVKAG